MTKYEQQLECVQTIPGVGRKSAVGLIAEIGLHKSVFPSAAHLASWTACPGNNASGGKVRSGRAALRTVLTDADTSRGTNQ